MAGFSRMYVLGGEGGFMGADGVNPIELLILVGDADRQWLKPHYFDNRIGPMGGIRVIVPKGPNHPDMLLDALIAFAPRYFTSCPSYAAVAADAEGLERLDFNAAPETIPDGWEPTSGRGPAGPRVNAPLDCRFRSALVGKGGNGGVRPGGVRLAP